MAAMIGAQVLRSFLNNFTVPTPKSQHMTKHSLAFIIFFLSFAQSVFAQSSPFRETFKTDSSSVEIIRNSLYKIYEERFNNKDSIWYSIHFIKDTTQLYTEGWMTQKRKRLGLWKEYNDEGTLMYTRDYEKGTCVVNQQEYPYHNLLQQMKAKADALIIKTYSKHFFEQHVVFNFNCYAYKGKWVMLRDSIPYFSQSYRGSWTEPMSEKPNSFLFRYQVHLSKKDEHWVELGIVLDSSGNYVPSSDDRWNNYGFEKTTSAQQSFKISKTKAAQIAQKQGLILSDTAVISEYLTWKNFKQKTFYNGQFRYYLTELTSKTPYTKGAYRKGIIFRFNVYIFNPWNGEFIEKKKMKSRREWGKHSGHRTGLMPDD